MKNSANVNDLIKALNYRKNAQVRSSAAEALGELKEKNAVEPLINALKDEDKSVIGSAILALGKIKDDRAIDPLVSTVGPWKLSVAKALGQIASDRAFDEQAKLVKNEPDKNTRMYIVIEIGKSGNRRAISTLVDISINDPESRVRNFAKVALHWFDHPEDKDKTIFAIS